MIDRHPRTTTLPVRRCDGCGQTAKEMVAAVATRLPMEQRDQAWGQLAAAVADLDIDWLVPAGATWREAHYCARCAPTGPAWSLEGATCQDGPLIALDPDALPGMPAPTAARAQAETYLRGLGWTITDTGTAICPRCT